MIRSWLPVPSLSSKAAAVSPAKLNLAAKSCTFDDDDLNAAKTHARDGERAQRYWRDSPRALLRAPDEASRKENYAAFVSDLKKAARLLAHSTE